MPDTVFDAWATNMGGIHVTLKIRSHPKKEAR